MFVCEFSLESLHSKRKGFLPFLYLKCHLYIPLPIIDEMEYKKGKNPFLDYYPPPPPFLIFLPYGILSTSIGSCTTVYGLLSPNSLYFNEKNNQSYEDYGSHKCVALKRYCLPSSGAGVTRTLTAAE